MNELRSVWLFCGLVVASPAVAQVTSPSRQQAETEEVEQQPPALTERQMVEPAQAGHLATSTVGEVGQRDVSGRAPTARIASRIQNRVQNRLRSRIDRNYDPQANANDPFAIAQDQARIAGRANR